MIFSKYKAAFVESSKLSIPHGMLGYIDMFNKFMKISIGSRIIDGPWGGGNLFVVNLKKFLQKNGHSVIHDLCDKDIDIILLTDPGVEKSSSTFNHEDTEI